MKTRFLMISAALFLMILCARSGSAQDGAAPAPDLRPQWLGNMLEEGWREMGEGVLEPGFSNFLYAHVMETKRLRQLSQTRLQFHDRTKVSQHGCSDLLSSIRAEGQQDRYKR